MMYGPLTCPLIWNRFFSNIGVYRKRDWKNPKVQVTLLPAVLRALFLLTLRLPTLLLQIMRSEPREVRPKWGWQVWGRGDSAMWGTVCTGFQSLLLFYSEVCSAALICWCQTYQKSDSGGLRTTITRISTVTNLYYFSLSVFWFKASVIVVHPE